MLYLASFQPFVYDRLMDIYAYNSLADYLNNIVVLRKQKSKDFSIRSWCSEIGISSSGSFNDVLNGNRPLPAKYIDKLISNLKLNRDESSYFKELYFYSLKNGKNADQDLSSMKKLNPKFWREKEILNTETQFHGLHFTLRVLEFHGLLTNGDFEEARSKLTSDIPDEDIKQALDYYKMAMDRDQLEKRLVTKPDQASENVQTGHQFYLELAKKRIAKVDVKHREYNTYSLGVKNKDIPAIKKRIRYFLDSLIEEYGVNEDPDQIYQLGNYFFPVTGDKK